MINPNYFGAMMIQYGLADGLVGGAGEYSSGLLRPLLQILKPLPEVRTVFGCMVMELPDRPVGDDDGVLFFADGAVIPEPTVEQLATIAVHTSALCCRLRDGRARTALLSFLDQGQQQFAGGPARLRRHGPRPAEGRDVYMETHPGREIEIDGEMQADTAIDPLLAQRKAPAASSRAAPTCSCSPTSTAATSRKSSCSTSPTRVPTAKSCSGCRARPPTCRAARRPRASWASRPSSGCKPSNTTRSIPE